MTSARTVAPYIGAKYNRLTIISEAPRGRGNRLCVNVRCECGTMKVHELSRVVNSSVLSCGCKYLENKTQYRNSWEIGPPKKKQQEVVNGTS